MRHSKVLQCAAMCNVLQSATKRYNEQRNLKVRNFAKLANLSCFAFHLVLLQDRYSKKCFQLPSSLISDSFSKKLRNLTFSKFRSQVEEFENFLFFKFKFQVSKYKFFEVSSVSEFKFRSFKV
jgi:hypothetical protein